MAGILKMAGKKKNLENGGNFLKQHEI